jgi:CRP-like cAMP-binding protein
VATAASTQAVSSLEFLVRKVERSRAIDDADRQAILDLPHTIRTLDVHAYIVREFDRAVSACLMLSGFSMRHKIVAGGHRQIVAIHMKGDFVDLQNSVLGTADHSVQMLTRGSLLMVPKADMERLILDRPAVARALWLDTLVDASVSREWIANIGRRDARTRVAHLLCELALRIELAGLGKQNAFELPMTQEQLADATGLTSVHVNRTLKQLERDGVIDRAHPKSLLIADWRKLADVGDFNSAYLHLQVGGPAVAS